MNAVLFGKFCPACAVPRHIPFPSIRVDDRLPCALTSSEGMSWRREPSLRDDFIYRSGSLLRLIANTVGQILTGLDSLAPSLRRKF